MSQIENTVWTRGYSDDYWNDPVTPLFFELLGDQLAQIVNVELNGIMGYSKNSQKTDQLLLLHRNHVYFNLEVLKRKVENEIPPMIRNNDVLNYFEDGDGPYGKETMRKQPFRLPKRAMAEIRVMLFDKNGSITKTASAYKKWSETQFSSFKTKFNQKYPILAQSRDINGLLKLAADLDKVMIGHFRLVRYGIPVHNIGMNLIAQYILSKFIGQVEATESYLVLLDGLEHKTKQTNDELFNLASMVNTYPDLRIKILNSPSKSLIAELRNDQDPAIKKFVEKIDQFFFNYGFRGYTREPYYPRWEEAPEHVFNILKSMTQEENSLQTKNCSSLSKEEVENRVRTQPLGWAKWKVFSLILGFARKYIIFREEQRFQLDQWITMNRKIYLTIGETFCLFDTLTEPRDIFFMRKCEIKKIINKQLDNTEIEKLKKTIDRRKREFIENEKITPPKFLRGKQESHETSCEGKTEFEGMPASRGLLSGPVRVLDKIDDICLVRRGEILVVPRTDPGWTPVFRIIGGLITETGGLLSHGAVVSREYGIPAVTNITNACQIFKTGQIVTIDGSKGTVKIKS
jgi:phosphohistidine swiveling domain-containing protein